MIEVGICVVVQRFLILITLVLVFGPHFCNKKALMLLWKAKAIMKTSVSSE